MLVSPNNHFKVYVLGFQVYMEIIWKPPSLLPGKWSTISIHEKRTAGYSQKMMGHGRIGISPASKKPRKPWLYTHVGVFNSFDFRGVQFLILDFLATRNPANSTHQLLGDMYLVEIPCNLQFTTGLQPPSQARWFLEFPWDFWLPSMPASSQAW